MFVQKVHFHKNNFYKNNNYNSHNAFGQNSKDKYISYNYENINTLRDSLRYSKPTLIKKNYQINGSEVQLDVKNLWNAGQNIVGKAYNMPVDIKITSGFFVFRKGNVSGNIANKKIDFNYEADANTKNIKITGDINNLSDKQKTLVMLLVSDKFKQDLNSAASLQMGAIAASVS